MAGRAPSQARRVREQFESKEISISDDSENKSPSRIKRFLADFAAGAAGRLSPSSAEKFGRPELSGVSLQEIRTLLGGEAKLGLTKARTKAQLALAGKRDRSRGRLRDIASESRLFLDADKEAERSLEKSIQEGVLSREEAEERQEDLANDIFQRKLRTKRATVGRKRGPGTPGTPGKPLSVGEKVQTVFDTQGNPVKIVTKDGKFIRRAK